MLERSVGEVVDGLAGRRPPVRDHRGGERVAGRHRGDRRPPRGGGPTEVVALHLPDADYGAALRAGLLAARGDVVVNFDVDYYDLAFVADAAARLDEADAPAIVVGSKRAVGAHDQRTALRRLVTGVFTGILRYGFGLRVSDTHGMKAMRRECGRADRPGLPLRHRPVRHRARAAGRAGGAAARSSCPSWWSSAARRARRSARRVPRTVWGLVRLRVLLWRDGASGPRGDEPLRRGPVPAPAPRPRGR